MLTVVTGLSGSGKSSLAFDTIYAEGQRRYVETLSTYARQFLDQMERPDVDSIDGLSPAISIEQKTTSRSPGPPSAPSPRSTTTCAALLLHRDPHCPQCGSEISRQTTGQILQHVLALEPGDRIMVWRRWCAAGRANTGKTWRSWPAGLRAGAHRRRAALAR
jgi:excinuclease ABC subunit A